MRILGRVCVYDVERDVCEVEDIGASEGKPRSQPRLRIITRLWDS